MNASVEEWRRIADFPDYAVSNHGRVRRVTRSKRNHAPRILKPWIGNHGYEAVHLVRDGVASPKLIHRLVCAAFHGPPPSPQHQAAHGDGTRRNNQATNLRWATRSENAEDARLHGVMATGARHGRTLSPEKTPRGELHGHAKLTEALVVEIRAAPSEPGSGRALAARYGVSAATISLIRSGKTWAHLQSAAP